MGAGAGPKKRLRLQPKRAAPGGSGSGNPANRICFFLLLLVIFIFFSPGSGYDPHIEFGSGSRALFFNEVAYHVSIKNPPLKILSRRIKFE